MQLAVWRRLSHGEVLGRTIGIVGYGRIGREVAERATGIKCRVLAAVRLQIVKVGSFCRPISRRSRKPSLVTLEALD
jgi:phosphoglycerate dehydrogenase-like enzyme